MKDEDKSKEQLIQELRKLRQEIAVLSEHKQEEGVLRDGGEGFRALVENSYDLINEIDSEGRVLYLSPNHSEIIGFHPSERVGHKIFENVHPDDLALVQRAFNQGAERKYGNVVCRYRSKNGEWRWLEARGRFYMNRQGKERGVIVSRDVTAWRKAEEALRESEKAAQQLAQENAAMAEIGRIISSTFNIDEIYESFSREAEKLISFDRIVINIINTEEGTVRNFYIAGEEVPDRNSEEIYPLEGSGNAEMVRTGSTFLVQTEDFHEYKDRFPMLWSTYQAGFRSIMNVPLFSKGKIIGGLLLRSRKLYAYTERDVRLAEKIASQIAGAVANAELFTQLRRTEEALREQRLLLDDILNSIPIPVFYKGIRGRFMGCNSAFLDFVGLPKERILDKTVADIYPAKLAETYHKADQDLLKTGGTQVYEVVLPFADESLHDVMIHKAVFQNVAREVSGLVGVIIDITERKRAEEGLRKHREHLEELVKERTERIKELESQRTEIEKKAATGLMAAQIAHEINNPLSGIKNSFLLVKDAISENHPYYEYVGRIEKEINRIARIVRQMFELYHPDQEIRNEFPVDKTIHDVVALLEAAWREKSLDITVDSKSAILIMPEGSLRQILYNILTNAIDASPKGGIIKIMTEIKDQVLILSIFDQGPGIPVEAQSHIFEPFFSTKHGYKSGLGLGLSISKEIVEKLGGHINFESETGNDTVFKIILPIKNAGGKGSERG